MKKVLTNLTLILVFSLLNQFTAKGLDTLKTSILNPLPTCAGNSITVKFDATKNLAAIDSIKLKFFNGSILLDSLKILNVFSSTPFLNQTSTLIMPPSVVGNNVNVQGVFYTDSVATWAFVKSTPNIVISAKPSINSTPISVCQGSNINIDTSSTTSAGTWTVIGSNSSIISTNGNLLGLTAGVDTIVFTTTVGACKDSHVVTINAKPIINSTPNSVCQGSNINIDTISTTLAGSWSVIGSNSSINSINGNLFGSSAGIDTIVFTTAIGSCKDSQVVTINAKPIINSTPNSVCQGSNINIDTFSTTLAGSWSVIGSNSSINSANGNLFGSSTGSDTVVFTTTIGSCKDSQVVTINANPSIVATFGTDVCVNSSISLSGTGTWSILAPSNSSLSINNITGLVTGLLDGSDNIVLTNSNSCMDTIAINVHALPTFSAITDTTICDGVPTNISFAPNVIGLGSVINNTNWSTLNPTSNITSALLSNQTINPIVTTLTNSSDTLDGSVDFRIITTTNFQCSDTIIFNEIVHPTPTTKLITPDTICNQSIVIFTTSTKDTSVIGLGGLNWSIPSIPPFINSFTQNLIGNAPKDSLINTLVNIDSNNTIQSLMYYITPTSIYGCVGTALNETVWVKPGTPNITAANFISNQICSNDFNDTTIKIIVPQNTGYSYAVTGDTGFISGWANQSTEINTNYIKDSLINNDSVNIRTLYYHFTFKTANSCGNDTITIAKLVKPIPKVNISSPNFYFCSEASKIIVFQSSVVSNINNFNVAYTLNGLIHDSISSSTSVDQIQLTDKFTNNDSFSLKNAGYTITSTANGCQSNNFTFTIPVHPSPTVQIFGDTICNGTSTSIALSSSTDGTQTFNWARLNSTGLNIDTLIQPYSGNGDNIIQNLFNNTNSIIGNIDYKITATTNGLGCVGKPYFYNQVVHPTPKIISSLTDTILCSNLFFIDTLKASTPGTNTFTWTAIGIPDSLLINPTIGYNNIINQFVVDSSNSTSRTYIDSIHLVSNINGLDCPSDTTRKVTVNPRPKLIISSIDSFICSGGATSIVLYSSSGGSSSFLWEKDTFNNNIIGDNNSGSVYLSEFKNDTLVSLNHTSIESIEYLVKVKSQNSCHSLDSFKVKQYVNPKPQLVASNSTDTICGLVGINYSPTSTTGGSTFSWHLKSPLKYKKYPSNADLDSIGTGGINEKYQYDITDNNTLITPVILEYQYNIVSDSNCTNSYPDSVNGNLYKLTINPTPKPFGGISYVDSANFCTTTGHQLLKIDRPTDSKENIKWEFLSPNNTHIWQAADSSNPNALLQSDSLKQFKITTSFDGFGCSLKDSTFTFNPILSATLQPDLIMKHYSNGDNVLICLNNNVVNVGGSNGYVWGRINKTTLAEDIFISEHGQEYKMTSFDNTDDTSTYFYWVQVELKKSGGAGDGCLRRVYLQDDKLGNKGIQEIEGTFNEFNMTIYPNPSNDILNIKLEAIMEPNQFAIEIFDFTGKRIWEQVLNQNFISLPIHQLSNGVYLVTCKHNGIKMASQKLIKF